MKTRNIISAVLTYLLILQWLPLPGTNCASTLPSFDNQTALTLANSNGPAGGAIAVNKFSVSPMASIARF